MRASPSSTIPLAGLWPIPAQAPFSAWWPRRRPRNSAPVPLLALRSNASFCELWATTRRRFAPGRRELDRQCLRGPRPDPGLAGIAKATASAGNPAEVTRWWDGIAAILASHWKQPLSRSPRRTPLDGLIAVHRRAAESAWPARRYARTLARYGVTWMAKPPPSLIAEFLLESARETLAGPRAALLSGPAAHLAMKVPVRPRAGRRRAIAIPGAAGSQAAALRSHHPGGIERRHLAGRTGPRPLVFASHARAIGAGTAGTIHRPGGA